MWLPAAKSSHKGTNSTGMFINSIIASLMLRIWRSQSPTSDVGWNFSILLIDKELRKCKFSPRPDFLLVPWHENASRSSFCPVLLGEVVSDMKHESDRYRMLLQLAVCTRMNSLAVRSRDPPLVHQAIYLSSEYKAERYLAYAETVVCYNRLHIKFGLADSLIELSWKGSDGLYRTGRI